MSGKPYGVKHLTPTLIPDLIRPYVLPSKVFVETGTNYGQGVQAAIDAGFETIYTCEANSDVFDGYVPPDRRGGTSLVQRYRMPSVEFLTRVMPLFDRPVTVFLDAHAVGDIPILEELNVLVNRSRRDDHVIMVDDVRMMGTPDWLNISKEEIVDSLKLVNPGYTITYVDTTNANKDLMVAYLRQENQKPWENGLN